MYIERVKREELNELCKTLFGRPNAWRKILEEGFVVQKTREVTESIPKDDGTFETKTTRVPVLTNSGGKISETHYHTVDSLTKFLIDLLVQKTEMMAKLESERAKKEALEKVQKAAEGSAV